MRAGEARQTVGTHRDLPAVGLHDEILVLIEIGVTTSRRWAEYDTDSPAPSHGAGGCRSSSLGAGETMCASAGMRSRTFSAELRGLKEVNHAQNVAP
jgi:hypothetical protein